ncbi:MAG: NAD(P)H-hydrate dehydratase, partial [Anaerolineae bacterium]|nr:NAD(P)H-hydrate dehydratase [Anaerolineae bacterium]
RDAHKGTFGKAMIAAGSVNYAGAAYLAGAAATRVGAGLVTLAIPQLLHPILAVKLVEATYLLLPHSTGVLNADAVDVLTEALPGYRALLIGPGLGQDKETVAFVHKLLGIQQTVKGRIGFQHGIETAPRPTALPPLVVDADGLNALAQVNRWWTYLPTNSVLTPHPGEMARLMKTEAIPADRIAVASAKATEWGQIVVLKGAHTVIAAPDGRITVLPFANSGLATAGTGDVLAGCIVGLLAQGLATFDAAVCGTYLHGLAGHKVAQKLGPAGMVAGDLLPELPCAISQVSRM